MVVPERPLQHPYLLLGPAEFPPQGGQAGLAGAWSVGEDGADLVGGGGQVGRHGAGVHWGQKEGVVTAGGQRAGLAKALQKKLADLTSSRGAFFLTMLIRDKYDL